MSERTGTALQDVAAAAAVYERAIESGRGAIIEFAATAEPEAESPPNRLSRPADRAQPEEKAMAKRSSSLTQHPVVAHDAWIAARKELLAREKEFTRSRDELSRARRELPWEKVEKAYVFEGPRGRESLADLFDGRSQFIVYHFMFGPKDDAGCKHCSFWADNFDGLDVHLNQRDATFVAISRAPLAQLEAFKRRMGWTFKWVSSADSDFNHDLRVSFTPAEVKGGAALYNFGTSEPYMEDREGVSVFYRDGGAVFHTYSTHARGIDLLNTAYNYMDLLPKGRDEDPDDPQSWVEYHDRYRS